MGRMIHSGAVVGFLAPPAKWPGVVRIVAPRDGATVDGAVGAQVDVQVDLAGVREAGGFHLFVDGRFRRAVTAGEAVKLSGLSPGSHRIKVWASAANRLLAPSHEIRIEVC